MGAQEFPWPRDFVSSCVERACHIATVPSLPFRVVEVCEHGFWAECLLHGRDESHLKMTYSRIYYLYRRGYCGTIKFVRHDGSRAEVTDRLVDPFFDPHIMWRINWET
jgi:hypothetical protein